MQLGASSSVAARQLPRGGSIWDQALPSQPLPPADHIEWSAESDSPLSPADHVEWSAEAPHRRLVTPPPAKQGERRSDLFRRLLGRTTRRSRDSLPDTSTGVLKDRTRGFEAPGRPRRQDGASEKPRPVAITSGIPTRFPRLGGPQRRGDAQAVRSRFNQKASRRTNNGWRPAKRESPSVAYGVSCRVRHEEVCREACASFTPLPSDCQRHIGWLVVGRRVWVPRSPQMSVCGDSALVFNCVAIVARRRLAVTSRYVVQPNASSSLRKSLILS